MELTSDDGFLITVLLVEYSILAQWMPSLSSGESHGFLFTRALHYVPTQSNSFLFSCTQRMS